nr:MAG TPA: Large polyvalent protein-associated domain 3 [Caudoviricetes sp.]
MNTQQRAILSKARRMLAMDAEWDESKHPRAENGQFGSDRPSENGRLNLPENPTRGDLRRAAKQWLSENLQGKTVPTSDGKKVTFNRNDSTDHLSFNASRSKLHAQAVTFVADVFQTGRFIGREELAHERKDNFVAFHKYQKQVEIDGYRVLLEAAAGELPNGELEAVDEMIAYNQRLAGKEKVGNAPASIETAKDNGQAAGFVSYVDNHTPFAEDGQAPETVGYIRIMKITDQNGRDVTGAYDEGRLSIAQDRSLRSYDQDGRLHVESSNISKATVNPYYGSEIPNYQQLGLDPKKVYYLLRDPEELEKAAPTFNNLPLLSKHIPVSADEPQKEVIAGTTGSDTVFKDGYLKCSLAVWDAEAIAGIESGEQVELSSAYHYTADMTAGEFEGRHYDGVMRDIVGNHVALVDVGRAGRDVVVSDADPFHERKTMKLKAGAKARIQAAVQPLLAQDAELSPDELLQVIGSLTNEVQTAEDDGEDLPPENVENVGTDEDEPEDGENNPAPAEPEEPAEDEEPEAPEGGAPKPAQDAAISKMAMDAAIKRAVEAERKRSQALATAQREVAHIVGDVAMDNAADVYKFALEQSGIDVTGVHPSAYRAMVGMLGKPKQPMAQDAAKTAEQFPGLSRIRKA